jgi:hypothetical protein
MDISSDNQLVPYIQGPRQVTPYSLRKAASVPADGYRRPRRFEPMPPPQYPDLKIQPGIQESIYSSNRRKQAPKSHRIGLLIDIYA